MVIYDLICTHSHEFEGWFKNREDFESQRTSGLLTCPICESAEITKKLTASKVAKKSNTSQSQTVVTGADNGFGDTNSPTFQQLQKMMGKVHQYIDNNFKDVGNKFAKEALKMHRGEKEPDNIRGTASSKELKELADEGVGALPIPAKPIDKDKLN